uniref:astacin-like metalloprotease toxin 5 isoform X2 n=1 Tax=Doryrhamphus excisus TaxID=161450 RepID=UPI0025AEA9CE|nr:astacin-like metalloprotease toxin 5 isoform X2 [Doryrhamphus excisus]
MLALVPPQTFYSIYYLGDVTTDTLVSQPEGMSLNATQNNMTLTQDPLEEQDSAETLEGLESDTWVEEGDILMQPLEDRNAVDVVWRDATMPYTISHGLRQQEQNILRALKMISDVTCIRFKKRSKEMNYVKFKKGRGCASFVGCRGGAQPLYYSKTCSVGNLCHEVMHTLGLHHEHTRKDRNKYITVQWENIKRGKKKHFKIKRGNMFNLPYDLESIMHYGKYFFSTNGRPTLLPKKRRVNMGQRSHLSKLDVQKLNKLYHCEERRRDRARGRAF